MAIEQKRGCGYRKVGGLYMVGGGVGVPCDRLPFELSVCSCCGQGIKQGMGWTWIDVAKFFQGPHTTGIDEQHSTGGLAFGNPCKCGFKIGRTTLPCPLCHHPEDLGRAGLLWIGEKFYKTPEAFVAEGIGMGFSRRVKAVPHDFKIGETYIMLAHSKAVVKDSPAMRLARNGGIVDMNGPTEYAPGIFYCWLPQRLERIRRESERDSEEVKADAKRGINAVYVPDGDPDHDNKRSVHEDHEIEQRKKREEESNQ